MLRMQRMLVLVAGILLPLAACGDGPPLLAPADELLPPLDMQLVVLSAGPGGAYGARVLREQQSCFLPAVAADGTVYPLADWPCEVQLTLTRNREDVANGRISAIVPNESGRAVRLAFGDPAPIPCWIEFDTDGDGTPDIVRETTKYAGIISAYGRIQISCHFSDT